MEKMRLRLTAVNKQPKRVSSPKETKKAGGDREASISSSQSNFHTQFFKKPRHEDSFKKLTRDEYLGIPESISGSSDTFHCVHGPEGKKYTEKGLLKRNILKELDPLPADGGWSGECPGVGGGWGLAHTIEFLVQDPTVEQQVSRLEAHLKDFADTSAQGFLVDTLDSVCVILEYLVERTQPACSPAPGLRAGFEMLLANLDNPILLRSSSDVVTYLPTIRRFIGFLGYLLLRLEEDAHFELVSRAVVRVVSARERRGAGAAPLRARVAAVPRTLPRAVARMLCIAPAPRFASFLHIALLLACHSVDHCLLMMHENIVENVLYRFNPRHPDPLPSYDLGPADPHDCNFKMGDSGVNMSLTLSLLLVLGKTTKQFLQDNPKYRNLLPCPDPYSQRCLVWALRVECRARGRRQQRASLVAAAALLLHIFRDALSEFCSTLMPEAEAAGLNEEAVHSTDVMALAVLTELPPARDWTATVSLDTSQLDVHFKKILIYFVVDLLKVFPCNSFMLEAKSWVVGLMYLVDPGLCRLRARWSVALFGELRRAALQALACVLPRAPPALPHRCGVIRRLLWYVEWYSENPFELGVLYWCMRALLAAVVARSENARELAVQSLFDTHGVVVLMETCYTLEARARRGEGGAPQRVGCVLALCVRALGAAARRGEGRRARCIARPSPHLRWPAALPELAATMLRHVLQSRDTHLTVSERWTVSLLNFIWEVVIWNPEYRQKFIADNGMYKLLDLISTSGRSVQCLALALACDATRSAGAVAHLLTWRAPPAASTAHPLVVKRGATIAGLLAAIFRDECIRTGVRLDEKGVILELADPLMSRNARAATVAASEGCRAAADLAGSRLSKVFALLHMLSEGLERRVSMADEAYNMYKNIKLAVEDETVLVLCAYYLTLKLNEVWREAESQALYLEPQDQTTLAEFLNINEGWAKEVRKRQLDVVESDREREREGERSLFAVLARVRLGNALEALVRVRCGARAGGAGGGALLADAVLAHRRRARAECPVIRTYTPALDDQHTTGQNVRVRSIRPKHKPKPLKLSTVASTNGEPSAI